MKYIVSAFKCLNDRYNTGFNIISSNSKFLNNNYNNINKKNKILKIYNNFKRLKMWIDYGESEYRQRVYLI